MHLEPFAEGTSFIHSLDPRVRIIALLIFIAIVALANTVSSLVICILFSLIGIVAARIRFRAVAQRLYAINAFVLFLWLIIPFSVPGAVLLQFGPLKLTREGLLYPIPLALKANAMMLATIVLIGTIPLFLIVQAFQQLKLPNKIIVLFFLSYRYLTVIHEEYISLLTAARLRGFRAHTTMHTYRTVANIVGMLLVLSNERAGRIFQAMQCRGFSGKFPTFHQLHFSTRDFVFLGSAMLVAILFFVLPLFRW